MTRPAQSRDKANAPRMEAGDCPEAITNPDHRIGPNGYIARSNWVQNMLKTHRQSQCSTCRLWIIWTPK